MQVTSMTILLLSLWSSRQFPLHSRIKSGKVNQKQVQTSLDFHKYQFKTERQRKRQKSCNASLWIHCAAPHDTWEWAWDRFWSITMHSNGTLLLDVPVDARCVYTLSPLLQSSLSYLVDSSVVI